MSDQMTQDKSCAAVGATTEAHQKLAAFAGTFDARVSMWMGPGDPMVSTGVMVNEMDLGGRFLRQTYTGHASDGPFPSFEGRGFWGYNTTDKRYEGFWIDSASTIMQSDTGDVDSSGRVWTMIGEMTNPKTGQPMTKKSVIRYEDKDHHSLQMYFPGPDGKECKCMAIEYVRKR